ncbi:MAG TPA: diaminopimelate decarboxylase, partial [Chloroflexota bacterium]|nr:diaminopimelate decarboxylase [Chloroflexota bacterium]
MTLESFQYLRGTLSCEGVSLSNIADAYGTPVYVYSESSIRARYHALDAAYEAVPHLICYALKANDSLAIARLLAELGAGVDVVSGGEAYKARIAGFPASKTIFAGVGKTRLEIADAIEQDILAFNVESPAELERIGEIALEKRKVARISVRVNPDVDPQTHPYISTGLKKSKFGVPAEKVVELYRRAGDLEFVDPVGIQMHIGSQLMHIQPIVDGVGRLARLVDDLRREGILLTYFDIGGGIGIQYADTAAEGPSDLAPRVVPVVKELGLTLLCEPGRYLVGQSGVLLTEVLYRKENGSKKFVVVDAAMNDLIRPSLYEAYHAIEPVCEAKSAPTEVVDVVGPVCESGDFFAHDRTLPPVQAGDRLAVLSAGAYGFSMASNYNARPRAAE